jgi:glucose/arabinose dehydrogenase
MPPRHLAGPLRWSVAVALLAAGAACSADDPGDGVSAPVLSSTSSSSSTSSPPSSSPRSTATTSVGTSTGTGNAGRTSVVATGLDVPWSVAFLPDGSALATLRDEARLLHLRDGRRPVDLGRVPGVEPGGEGGLLGVAVSPDFATDRTVFVYFTAAEDNRVARLAFEDGRTTSPRAILTGIPKAGNHNGGRLAFGPDGHLYVATGDASEGDQSQDRRSLAGKILRVTRDGRPAPGNPFDGSPVWSLGHRNVQGLAWAPDGTMYASEFGQNTWDELNRIQPGRNYGWPVVEGRAGRSGFVDPLAQWATSDASPSGIAVAGDAVWMAALRGQSLWRIPISGNRAGTPTRLFEDRYGRLRDVVLAPDGRLWVVTNNTSRGNADEDDDRVLAFPLDELA